MPEHVHILMLPRLPDWPVSRVMWWLKRDSAKDIIGRWKESQSSFLARIESGNGYRIWQRGGGYDRNIYSQSELDEKIKYINENPVQRGLVQVETDWPWSSARWYAGSRDEDVRIDPIR